MLAREGKKREKPRPWRSKLPTGEEVEEGRSVCEWEGKEYSYNRGHATV